MEIFVKIFYLPFKINSVTLSREKKGGNYGCTNQLYKRFYNRKHKL